jgi:hypothetical protein
VSFGGRIERLYVGWILSKASNTLRIFRIIPPIQTARGMEAAQEFFEAWI